jgi:hypothetical protein
MGTDELIEKFTDNTRDGTDRESGYPDRLHSSSQLILVVFTEELENT